VCLVGLHSPEQRVSRLEHLARAEQRCGLDHPRGEQRGGQCISIYLCIYLSIYMSMYLSVYLSMYLCLCVCMKHLRRRAQQSCELDHPSSGKRKSHCVSIYLCIYASVYLCIQLSIHLCIDTSRYLCVYIRIYALNIDVGSTIPGAEREGITACLSIYRSIYLSIYLSIYPSMCRYISISVCICLYVCAE